MGLIIDTDYFGSDPGKIAISFNNGSEIVDGYIINQVGSRRYVVSPLNSDDNNKYTITLARTLDDLVELTPNLGTIKIFPFIGGKISSTPEHIHRIEQFVCYTVEGHRYGWKFANHILPPNPARREGEGNIDQIV